MPIGSLKHAVAYPNPTDSLDDEEVKAALTDAELGHLVDRIHEEVPWERTLSGGEQQRLTFAQLFIQAPDIIVMDEATSALDGDAQEILMERITQRLPDAAMISVGHRPELEAFHNRRLVLARRKDGARLVADEVLTPATFALRRAFSPDLPQAPGFSRQPIARSSRNADLSKQAPTAKRLCSVKRSATLRYPETSVARDYSLT